MKRKQSDITAADVEARIAELAALRKVKGRRPIPRFVAALRDPDLPVAKTAAMGLCDRDAILAPLRELLADPDPLLRWRACALAWFFMIKGFVPDLIAALRDGDPMVRAEAAWAMRCADTDAAAAALLKATRDPSGMVAHYAAWTLRRILKPRYPRLPSLKGSRIPPRPLRPEPRQPVRPPAAEVDDARAFEQLSCWTDLPVYRAPLVAPPAAGWRAGPPKTDGRRDPCRRARAATLIHIDGYPAPPLRRTDFRVVCSREALHFHVRCQYRGKGELAARHSHYGEPVYADNSIEIFLEPAGTGRVPYFQICLNTRNARCDVRRSGPPGHTWRPAGARDEPWQPQRIQSAVRVEKGFWHAELTVPFAELGLAGGKVNKLWRMNIVRNAYLFGGGQGGQPEGSETTSWANMGEHDAHQPRRFGYLWVDAGSIVSPACLRQIGRGDGSILDVEPLPLRPGLKGWKVLAGKLRAGGGEIAPVRGTRSPRPRADRSRPWSLSALLRWEQPIPFESFEVAAQIQIRQQVRFLFSPDRANMDLSFMAAYIHPINEINVAGIRHWKHWAPPYPGHLSIYKEVYPRLTHSHWYDVAVRVRPDRVQCLLDGAVQMELPNPCQPAAGGQGRPGVRYLTLHLVGGGRLRKPRLRPLE